MDDHWLPRLPAGYKWAAMKLVDGRTVIEVRFEDRELVAYAFQPKRRRCWYLGGDRLGRTPFGEVLQPQCATMAEACDRLAQWAKEHLRHVRLP
ncbi:hypothetical protein [Lysobacter capsici]|uniref:hypothetical protein n=1 Tax=Lysobacter capsici TaxID=435897 RepID=UPI00128BCB1D|nr:hypothetical protein [Lysobacter capsici]